MKMKLASLALALSAAAGSASAAPAAAANIDGNVVITGQIVAQTCTLASGTGSDVNVTLPTINKSLLSTKGVTAGRTPFVIQLTNCGAAATGTAVPKTVGVYFSPDATFDSGTGTLKNLAASGAPNVSVQLLNADKSVINIGQDLTGHNVIYPQALATTPINLSYFAQYYALDSGVDAGAVSAKAPFTIVYQ